MQSMTGYGRFEGQLDGVTYLVEMKSVNHRFCDISLHMPRQLLMYEETLKKSIQEHVQRGRIDVFIQVDCAQMMGKKINIDWELAKSYYQAARQLQESFELVGQVSVQHMLGMEALFQIDEHSRVVDQGDGHVNHAVKQATVDLLKMRQTEGNALAQDIHLRIKHIQEVTSEIISQAPQVKHHYQQLLEERLREFLNDRVELDEGKILHEVCLYAEKSNIDEELIRLASHADQFLKLVLTNVPIGRKLDFVLQEMNREVNTIGSKAHSFKISEHVVELKSELEKIREQVQNIE